MSALIHHYTWATTEPKSVPKTEKKTSSSLRSLPQLQSYYFLLFSSASFIHYDVITGNCSLIQWKLVSRSLQNWGCRNNSQSRLGWISPKAAIAAVRFLLTRLLLCNGTAREKVTKKQDLLGTSSGFPCSGQPPATHENVTDKNVPILCSIMPKKLLADSAPNKQHLLWFLWQLFSWCKKSDGTSALFSWKRTCS